MSSATASSHTRYIGERRLMRNATLHTKSNHRLCLDAAVLHAVVSPPMTSHRYNLSFPSHIKQ